MQNISMGGIAVEMTDVSVLKVGETVLVEIPLGRSLSRLKTRCRVVDVRHEDSTAHLAFVDESQVFLRAVEASVAEWKARTSSQS